jgi:GAF domain-containing protein
MDPAGDARLNALLKGKDCMEPFDDPHILQAQIINILFDLIPAATRVALLLRWENEPEGPEDFQSSMYGKRAGKPKRFRVSEKALEFVYTYREPYISTNENDEKPPCICAPLKVAGWTMIGVIYLDTREPGGFEIEDVEVLETISLSAAKLIRRSLQLRTDREEMDSYQELLKLDDLNEPEGQ